MFNLLQTLYEKLFSSSTSGAAAVREAIQEAKDLAESEYTGKLGEPDIIKGGGKHFNRPMIEVPLHDLPFGESQRIFFEVPGGQDAPEMFNELLDVFNLNLENMGNLAGEEVPVTFVGGNVMVDWQKVIGTKGDAAEPWTEEEIRQKAKAATESDSTDSSDKGGEPSGEIQVEEETISGEAPKGDGKAEDEIPEPPVDPGNYTPQNISNAVESNPRPAVVTALLKAERDGENRKAMREAIQDL